MEELANKVAVLLREGYSFYEACREAGVHPSEFSTIGQILGKRRRTNKRRFFVKRTTTVYSKEKTTIKTVEKVVCTANFTCKVCKEDCLFRQK